MNNNGELIVQKCPSCGATADLDQNQAFGFCKYCGSKIIKKESIVQKVEITNPIQIQGDVKVVNNEFEAKLAKVDHKAQKFLENPGTIIPIVIEEKVKEIIDDYKELENIGANEAKLWEHFLDYYIKINMNEKWHIFSIKEFEVTVKDAYNQILKFEFDENIRKRYEPEDIIFKFKEKHNRYIKEESKWILVEIVGLIIGIGGLIFFNSI